MGSTAYHKFPTFIFRQFLNEKVDLLCYLTGELLFFNLRVALKHRKNPRVFFFVFIFHSDSHSSKVTPKAKGWSSKQEGLDDDYPSSKRFFSGSSGGLLVNHI